MNTLVNSVESGGTPSGAAGHAPVAARKPWSLAELSLLRANYANSRTDDLALALGRSLTTVYQKATAIGLRKSAEYLASDNAGRIQRGKQNEGMKASQFRAGQPAWNKGIKGVVGVQEACRATQFKKGSKPHTWVPVGTLRVSSEGILERKLNDLPGPNTVRWTPVHRLVWMEANGPIPTGHVVVFRPGRKTTTLEQITPDALECLSRLDLMKRNSVHAQYPKEIARLVQLRGAITRQINRRTKEEA